MKKLLWIDASVTENSRTRALAQYLIDRQDADCTHITIRDGELPPLTRETLAWRDGCCRSRDFGDAYFRFAKQFADADLIVISAPFWDLSFPAVLKKYLETVSVNGLTFHYTAEGRPEGLCKAQRLYYVTTTGGPFQPMTYGFEYVKALTTGLFGVKEAVLCKAEGLDILGADTETILARARQSIDEMLRGEAR